VGGKGGSMLGLNGERRGANLVLRIDQYKRRKCHQKNRQKGKRRRNFWHKEKFGGSRPADQRGGKGRAAKCKAAGQTMKKGGLGGENCVEGEGQFPRWNKRNPKRVRQVTTNKNQSRNRRGNHQEILEVPDRREVLGGDTPDKKKASCWGRTVRLTLNRGGGHEGPARDCKRKGLEGRKRTQLEEGSLPGKTKVGHPRIKIRRKATCSRKKIVQEKLACGKKRRREDSRGEAAEKNPAGDGGTM